MHLNMPYFSLIVVNKSYFKGNKVYISQKKWINILGHIYVLRTIQCFYYKSCI